MKIRRASITRVYIIIAACSNFVPNIVKIKYRKITGEFFRKERIDSKRERACKFVR